MTNFVDYNMPMINNVQMKYTWKKRFSKFISKMFWHFNQSVPNYSVSNRRSMDKHGLKSMDSLMHQQHIYPIRFRKCSLRNGPSTLMSIKEENEIELLNCT
jgi:hypothetical protein